jgi:phytoene dehydrogenase-like protein
LSDYLNGLTGCRELKAVLAACNSRYGLPPSECPTYIHFFVLDSYLKSAWRVDETYCPLSRAFVEALRELGGQVRCGTRIAAIECPSRQTRGVRLADGEFIPAKTVFFTGNPKQLPALCREELRPTYRQHLEAARETPGAFVAALRWESTRCPMGDRDIYLYDTWDLEDTYRQRHLSSDDKPHLVYCAASEQKTNGAFPLTAQCLMAGEEMSPWSAGSVGIRPEGYGAVKQQMAEKMVSILQHHWPGQAKLSVVDTFTPLTIRNYTLSPMGSCFGLIPSRLTACTRITGFHLAGQSLYSPGIMGALISAVDVCGAILGRTELRAQIEAVTTRTSCSLPHRSLTECAVREVSV